MAADTQPSVLDDAWGHIPPSRQATAGIGSFTRTRVERIISVVAGLGSLVLGVQAFVTSLGPAPERPGWHLPLMLLVFVPLAVMILTCVVGRGVRIAAGAFAFAYVLSLVLWPIATAGIAPDVAEAPWIWYLVNIATLAAVLAFPLPLQIVWTVLAPVLYGLVRLIQGGFAPDFWFSVGLDVSFALILGGVLLTLGWLLRAVAANVDETRARAVDSYARASAAEAAEQERVAVAALMHDSVLAALIAAERADSARARVLAATMAREALTRLANAEQGGPEGPDEPRELGQIADDIAAAARDLGVDVPLERDFAPDTPSVPGRVARALVLAATQAVANSLEHADGVGLAVLVRGRGDDLSIEVHDLGDGFDVHGIPDDRLGIRASIVARVAAVGGTAAIDSDAGGTVVRLRWASS